MKRLIINMFIISFINLRSGAAFPWNLINISTSISWGDSVLKRGLTHYDMILVKENTSSSSLSEIFSEVDEIAEEFTKLSQTIKKEYKKRFDIVIESYSDVSHHSIRPREINDYIHIVNFFYNNTRSHVRVGKTIDDTTLDEYFTQTVLIDSVSLPTALEKIRSKIFVASHYNRLSKEVVLNDINKVNQMHSCNKLISSQLSMFFAYVNLLITEMRGLTTLVYIYSLLQRRNKTADCKIHLKAAGIAFKKYITSYHIRTKKEMALLSRDIHRCEIDLPQRNINFIEFNNYHRIELISASTLGAESEGEAFNLCGTDCKMLDHSFLANKDGLKIDNVKTVGYNDEITVCPLVDGSHIRFLWWASQHQHFGPNETCPDETKFATLGFLNLLPHCHACSCSIIKTQYYRDGHILRIGVSPQTSDVLNNMIVVGVKFVTHEDVIHLQIQQGKYSYDAMINNTSWKELGDNHKSKVDEKLDHEMLAEFSGQLYLDDVILPPKYAVTGVRFSGHKTAPEGFHLEVRGTPLDLITGELIPDRSDWFSAVDANSSKTSDYGRKRIKIKMTDPDDPIRCRGYSYDEASNKFIRFTHSSVMKDAGQSTVPYIDAQPVETYPSFPLNGIGLFYRDREGCGGYIAPRIFTYAIFS